MAFIGSINAETRKWLGNNGPAFDGRQVYVGCSGAFTVEQLLTRYAPKAKLWGNDVSLYSGVLGAYLAGQPFRLDVREEKFAWLEPYLADEEAKAATVMVLFEMLKYEKANNLFKQRHWLHYLNTFADFHHGTVEKLRERKKETRMEAYTTRDIFDLLDEIPKDAVVIAFLPTYAGGYELMFKRLEEIFDWDSPSYGLPGCRPFPFIPRSINGGGRWVYHIIFQRPPTENGETRVTVDGIDQPDNTIPLVDSQQEHYVGVNLPVGRSYTQN